MARYDESGRLSELTGPLCEARHFIQLGRAVSVLFGAHASLVPVASSLFRVVGPATGETLAYIEFERDDDECGRARWSIQPVLEGEDEEGQRPAS